MTKPNEILIKRENGVYSVWLGFPETIPQRTHRALIDFVETGRLAYYRDDDFTKSSDLTNVKMFIAAKDLSEVPVVLRTVETKKYSNFDQFLGA